MTTIDERFNLRQGRSRNWRCLLPLFDRGTGHVRVWDESDSAGYCYKRLQRVFSL